MDEKSICNMVRNMLQSEYGIVPLPLENYTDDVQMPLPEGGEQTMAKHRMRICIGFNDDGSAIEKMISGNTQHELADRIVAAMLNSERRGEFLAKCGITGSGCTVVKSVPLFGEYAENWLTVYKVGKLKPKTLKGYRDQLKCHLIPVFGNVRLDEITADGIQEFLNDRKEYSHKSLQSLHGLLSQILSAAVADKLIDRNPAKDSRIFNPSDIINERRALTSEEWIDVINQLDNLKGFDRLYVAILVFTGLRRGEILGLCWQDIDLENNVIHVRRNVTHTFNAPIIGTPKTEKGKRDVPIMQGLLKYLLPLKGEGYIVSHEKTPDKPLSQRAFNNMWKRIEEAIDLHGATSHVFRHTITTLLYDTGADDKTIQSIVGHADIGTTMNTYVHARDDKKRSAMERLNDKISA